MYDDPWQIEALRDAYMRDVLDLDTFERYVAVALNGGVVALPLEAGETIRNASPPLRF